MSFITYQGEMVRDLFPNAIGRPLIDDVTYASASPWQLVPDSFDEICNWADVISVGRDSTGSLRYKLVYKTEGDDQNRLEVRLRLQGFLSNAAIGPLGDWNG